MLISRVLLCIRESWSCIGRVLPQDSSCSGRFPHVWALHSEGWAFSWMMLILTKTTAIWAVYVSVIVFECKKLVYPSRVSGLCCILKLNLSSEKPKRTLDLLQSHIRICNPYSQLFCISRLGLVYILETKLLSELVAKLTIIMSCVWCWFFFLSFEILTCKLQCSIPWKTITFLHAQWIFFSLQVPRKPIKKITMV